MFRLRTFRQDFCGRALLLFARNKHDLVGVPELSIAADKVLLRVTISICVRERGILTLMGHIAAQVQIPLQTCASNITTRNPYLVHLIQLARCLEQSSGCLCRKEAHTAAKMVRHS